MQQVFDAFASLSAWFSFLPAWIIAIIVLTAGVIIAVSIHQFAYHFATKWLRQSDNFAWLLIVQKACGPSRFAAGLLGLAVGAQIAPISGEIATLVTRVMQIALIMLLTWFAIVTVDIFGSVYLQRFRVDVEDNLLARKHVTQVRILKRVAATLIVVIGLSAALMTFDQVRQYGVSLFASAGVAGLAIGLAARPLLSNLIAGIQIAMTQPIRIDDVVIVEGEYGTVEEITSTYIVVRLWDWRRMVLPLSYFIEKPFQNWTRESASLIGTVLLYADYSVRIDELRNKLNEVVKATDLWDERVVNLQVVDATEQSLQLRILVSARTAAAAWDLRCFVRERLISYLQSQQASALPRRRQEVVRLEDVAARTAAASKRPSSASPAAELGRRSRGA
jgi:small-conductance mechanosensitive channel